VHVTVFNKSQTHLFYIVAGCTMKTKQTNLEILKYAKKSHSQCAEDRMQQLQFTLANKTQKLLFSNFGHYNASTNKSRWTPSIY